MPQFAKSFRFDLTNALASHREMLADLFQRVFRSGRSQSKTHLDYFLLAWRQRRQDLIGDLTQVRSNHGVGWIQYRLVFDKVAQMGIFLFTNGRLEGDGFLSYLQHLAHL